MRSSLFFAVILSISRPLATFFPSAHAALVNRTIDDSDIHSINYVPSDKWTSNTACSGCLKPDAQNAFQQSFHYGIHPAPPTDEDDQDSVNTGAAPDNDARKGANSGKKGGKSGSSPPKRSLRFTKWRRDDADDPNFVDVNVTASLNFTGSAFYVYCVLPVQTDNATILSKTNLTFLLDGGRVGSFEHDPQTESGSTPGFQYQHLVFSKDDLPHAQHVLEIHTMLGSMVLLDYLQYSTLDSDDGSSSSTSGASPAPTPSGAINSQTNSGSNSKKNTATFGAAIGSTVGVLALISFAVFVSIWRRRHKSAKREKRREAQEAAARPPSPEMRGPQPFIPRYFPGASGPRSPPSPPPFSPSSSSGGVEELGPSHGLDMPPAPEHVDAPAYTPPALVLSERMGRVLLTLPTLPASVLLPAAEDDSVPPRYQDVGRSPLVTVPVFTHVPPPPDLIESPSSVRSPGGESPTSTTALFPGRPDSSSVGSTAGHGEPTIHTNDDQRPR